MEYAQQPVMRCLERMLRFRTMLALDEPIFLVLGEMPRDQHGAQLRRALDERP